MEITTYTGRIKGFYKNNLYQFLGIPYAKAKRFQKPFPIKWDDCLDCCHYGPKCPQIEKDNPTYEGQDEDCLHLNVYTPTLDKKLPVLVEIHGGAFQKGSNQKMFPEHVIENDEFIYITINYRLGIFGYLYLSKEFGSDYDTSGNNGLLDQISAIQWIYNNVECFGGDKNKITILGSSAGAKSLATLMSIDGMQRYFQQVILMSGAYQSIRSTHTAQEITAQFKSVVPCQFKDILSLPFQQLLNYQKEFFHDRQSVCFFGPVVDNIVVMENYLSFQHWKGKVIIGSSLNELAFYPNPPTINQKNSEILNDLFGKNASIVWKDYQELIKKLSNQEAWGKILSDNMYRTYSYRFAQLLSQRGCQVYQYSSHFLPAFHCLDHVLCFKPSNEYPVEFQNKEAITLGINIRKNFIHFVTCHSPFDSNWKPISDTNKQMIWDTTPYLKDILEDDTCQNINEQVFIL